MNTALTSIGLLVFFFFCIFVVGGIAAFSVINLDNSQLCSYHPIPMVFSQAKGSCVWDPEGNKYIDFLSAYSAVNQVFISYDL